MNKFQSYTVSMVAVMVAFLLLDGIWLGIVAKGIYASAMADLLRSEYPIAPWVTFYIMYAFVITHLAVIANVNKPVLFSVRDGALLGLASYGAYNLTNYAVLNGWPLPITLIDWFWGTCLTAACAGVGATVLRKLNPQS